MKRCDNWKWEEFLPKWAVLPLLSILAVNAVVYWGSGILTRNVYHYDLTINLDRMVPFLPAFVWIYILAFPFWAANYILSSWRGKKEFWRFVVTDLTIHTICFVFFLLLPTTNVRPEITGNGISDRVLALIYAMDGGANPTNLFPSIHCYVSWMCVYAVEGQKRIPVWYQRFSVIFALLVIVSTQVLKQHYMVDAVAGILLVEVVRRFYAKGKGAVLFEKFFERWEKKK